MPPQAGIVTGNRVAAAGMPRRIIRFGAGTFPIPCITVARGPLLEHPGIDASVTPTADGGEAAAMTQGGANAAHRGNPRFDTADFNDTAPGNLRVDYVLPSANLAVVAAGVFWPMEGHPGAASIDASDHRLIWTDVALPAR